MSFRRLEIEKPFNFQGLCLETFGCRKLISCLFWQMTQATTGPSEPHAANLTWVPEEKVLEHEGQALALESALGQEMDIDDFLNSKLQSHPKLHRGRLSNGLQFVILPNKVPPNRYGYKGMLREVSCEAAGHSSVYFEHFLDLILKQIEQARCFRPTFSFERNSSYNLWALLSNKLLH